MIFERAVMNSKEFAEYVAQDLLSGVEGVTTRFMFGCYGLYRNGLIFGIIIAGEIYFKMDSENQKKYEAAGSRPFTYARDGKMCAMKYWLVPPCVLESRDQILQWALLSCSISRSKNKA